MFIIMRVGLQHYEGLSQAEW